MSSRQSPLGIVAGTGIDLRGLLDHVTREQSFLEVPGLCLPGVEGHTGRFIHGSCGAIPGRPVPGRPVPGRPVRIVLQCGRLHFYEGLEYEAVARPVDVLAGFGVRTVLFTNAAGGLLPAMIPGDLLSVECVQPFVRYAGWPTAPDEVTTDFALPGCAFTGTYIWVHGPNFETRAEIRALQTFGGAAVGMSTFPELVRCRELGLRAGAISCITNNCCRPERLTHACVIEAAQRASGRITDLIRRNLRTLESV